MRTLPLFSSVAQMPNGVVGAGATAGAAATGAGGGRGAALGAAMAGATSLATGAGAVEAIVVAGAGGASGATGCGGLAGTGGAVFCAGGFELSATSLSSLFDLKPLKPERLGAEILRQGSSSQFFCASMRILCPSILKKNELPALAGALAPSHTGVMLNLFLGVSPGAVY